MKQHYSTLIAAVCLLMVMGLPVLYVLSVGPVIWVHHHYPISQPLMGILETIYFPLDWLHESSELGARLLDWYRQFWLLLTIGSI